MNIYVSQIYQEAGVNYPFTHRFQQFISKAITERIVESERFAAQYGKDFDLIFRMSAKSDIAETEIKGPTVFKKDNDVEYTIFLPFRGDGYDSTSLYEVVKLLLSGIVHVLDELGFDSARVSDNADEIARHAIETPAMFE